MKIVAIIHKSAGSESVGEMWRETKIFEPSTPLAEVFKWASNSLEIVSFKGHLEITIAQD